MTSEMPLDSVGLPRGPHQPRTGRLLRCRTPHSPRSQPANLCAVPVRRPDQLPLTTGASSRPGGSSLTLSTTKPPLAHCRMLKQPLSCGMLSRVAQVRVHRGEHFPVHGVMTDHHSMYLLVDWQRTRRPLKTRHPRRVRWSVLSGYACGLRVASREQSASAQGGMTGCVTITDVLAVAAGSWPVRRRRCEVACWRRAEGCCACGCSCPGGCVCGCCCRSPCRLFGYLSTASRLPPNAVIRQPGRPGRFARPTRQ